MQNYRKYREKERSGSSETIHRYREEYKTACAVIDKDSIAQISSKIKNIPDSDLVKSAHSGRNPNHQGGHPITSDKSSGKTEKKDGHRDEAEEIYLGEYDTEQDTDELGATFTTNS